jgi:hypothetical protein
LGALGWSVETVDAVGDVGRACALSVLDTTLFAAYYDASNHDLKFTRWHSGVWTTPQVVDASGDDGKAVGIGQSGAALARIAYYDATRGVLRFARQHGDGSWDFSDVDTSPNVGSVISLWVDQANDLSQIAYYDATNKRVKFAMEQPGPAAVGDQSDQAAGMLRLAVLPNPLSAGAPFKVRAALAEAQNCDLFAFDISGRCVAARTSVRIGGDSPEILWTIPRLEPGVVFVEARLRDGRKFSCRAVAIR